MSIAANVAHSYVPPAGAAADWSPPGGAVVGAIFWPVALFVAVEILARIAWPSGLRWDVLRFGGLVPVAGVAAFVSYRHLSGLLAFYGEGGSTAIFGPLAVDGLMVMATGALLATAHGTTTLAAAPVASTAPAAAEPSTAKSSVAAPPDAKPAPAPTVKKTPVKRVTPRPASAVKVAKAAAKMPGAPVAQIAAKAGVSPSTARRHLAALNATNASPTEPQPAQTPTLTAA
ncbi:helix-turn-helix domain-containing protein [Couchioplanes azureus]|uniref:helix-turn-helix domain-containing protein n=1 Tax=Couchioplanes caeruleus TaxID=56438 RepID=UPI00166FFAF0|nr:helix-turn-helix domain-containing protein [Couchioplanes caeruleus]